MNNTFSVQFDYDSEVFKAWTAAWVDTEGCLRITGRTQRKNGQWRSHQPVMEICQTEIEPLLIIQEAYGGSIHHRKRQEHSRRVYELHVTNRKLEALLIDVLPYLIVKQQQARLIIEFYRQVDSRLNGSKPGRHTPVPEGVIVERERLRMAVKSYNKRPLSAGLLF